MCEIDHLEACPVWEENPSLARKVHECDMCDGRIEIGEPYIRHRSLLDGRWTAEKKCQPCAQIYDSFLKEHHGASNPSYMRTMLSDCVGGAEYHPLTAEWALALSQMRGRSVAAKAVKRADVSIASQANALPARRREAGAGHGLV